MTRIVVHNHGASSGDYKPHFEMINTILKLIYIGLFFTASSKNKNSGDLKALGYRLVILLVTLSFFNDNMHSALGSLIVLCHCKHWNRRFYTFKSKQFIYYKADEGLNKAIICAVIMDNNLRYNCCPARSGWVNTLRIVCKQGVLY